MAGRPIHNVTDYGHLGGHQKCANTEDDDKVPVVICAWADYGSIGLGIFYGTRGRWTPARPSCATSARRWFGAAETGRERYCPLRTDTARDLGDNLLGNLRFDEFADCPMRPAGSFVETLGRTVLSFRCGPAELCDRVSGR